MKKTIKEKWIDALKSGEYKQWSVDSKTVRPHVPELEWESTSVDVIASGNTEYSYIIVDLGEDGYSASGYDIDLGQFDDLKEAKAYANEHNRKRVLDGLGITE